MLTAIIIVARVQPGTSKGITDLLLPQPSSVLKSCLAVPLVSPYESMHAADLPYITHGKKESNCQHREGEKQRILTHRVTGETETIHALTSPNSQIAPQAPEGAQW